MTRENQLPDWLLEIEREDRRKEKDDKEAHDAMYDEEEVKKDD